MVFFLNKRFHVSHMVYWVVYLSVNTEGQVQIPLWTYSFLKKFYFYLIRHFFSKWLQKTYRLPRAEGRTVKVRLLQRLYSLINVKKKILKRPLPRHSSENKIKSRKRNWVFLHLDYGKFWTFNEEQTLKIGHLLP